MDENQPPLTPDDIQRLIEARDEADRAGAEPVAEVTRAHVEALGFTEAEIEAAVAKAIQTLETLHDPAARPAGAREVRRGVRTLVEMRTPTQADMLMADLNGDAVTYRTAALGVFANAEARRRRRGRPDPVTPEDFLAGVRAFADRTYAAHGLPTGAPTYVCVGDADPGDAASWRPAAQVPPAERGEAGRLEHAWSLPAAKAFPPGHPVDLARLVHDHAMMLGGATAGLPPELAGRVLEIIQRSFALSKAIDDLEAVTGTRRDSGKSLAATVDSGVAALKRNRKGGTTRGAFRTQESQAIASDVAEHGARIRNAIPAIADDDLATAVHAEMRGKATWATVRKHIRALKKAGRIPARQGS